MLSSSLQTAPANVSTAALAIQYGLSWKTAHRWRYADDGVMDRSHRPHTIRATLNEAQEALVLLLREKLLIGLDDLLRKKPSSPTSRALSMWISNTCPSWKESLPAVICLSLFESSRV